MSLQPRSAAAVGSKAHRSVPPTPSPPHSSTTAAPPRLHTRTKVRTSPSVLLGRAWRQASIPRRDSTRRTEAEVRSLRARASVREAPRRLQVEERSLPIGHQHQVRHPPLGRARGNRLARTADEHQLRGSLRSTSGTVKLQSAPSARPTVLPNWSALSRNNASATAAWMRSPSSCSRTRGTRREDTGPLRSRLGQNRGAGEEVSQQLVRTHLPLIRRQRRQRGHVAMHSKRGPRTVAVARRREPLVKQPG